MPDPDEKGLPITQQPSQPSQSNDLRAAAAGDLAAGERIYQFASDMFQRRLMHRIRRLPGPTEVAKDLVQEAVHALIESAGKPNNSPGWVDPDGSWRGWLYQRLRWRADDARRAGDPMITESSLSEQNALQNAHHDEGSIIENATTYISLKTAILMLPKRQRVVIEAYYFANMSLKEIAPLIGVMTESRVSQIKKEAVKNLKSYLGEEILRDE